LNNIKKIIALVVIILSAIGSNNFPKEVTWLYFLAKKPSNQSVIIANTKTIPDKYSHIVSGS
jgi:hypothetical protein